MRHYATRAGIPARYFAADSGQSGPGGHAWRPSGVAGRRLEGSRILIVEDEALVALDLEFAFEDEGAEIVGPALTLRDALDVLRAEPAIHGAVLDVDLAGTDVFPVAKLLRARGIPFVFHTGHATRATLDQMFPGSITCAKPTMPTMLIAALLRLIN